MPNPQTLKLALDKLGESGLDEEDAKKLGLVFLDGAETAAIGITRHACPAICFNYMDPWHPGKPLTPYPKHPAFKRYRFVGPNIPTAANGKRLRYIQAAGSGVCAYFPTNADWAGVKDDPSKSIYLTEGEIKAAAACKLGMLCIGLGGVANFVNPAMGHGFLPELEAINWVGRRLYIIFDNDGSPKPMVVEMLNKLAEMIQSRGGFVFTVFLQAVPGLAKTGLDDFIVHYGKHELAKAVRASEMMLLSKPLWEMNDTHGVIMNPPMILNKLTDRVSRASDFTNLTHANDTVPEQKMMPDGTISNKLVSLAQHWVKWKMRSQYTELAYSPGQPREPEDGTWNAWKGWGSKPVKGDVKPFLELLRYVFGTDSKGLEAQKWFLQWCAYPIQHPGAKLYTAVMLWSRQHGMGKTLLGYVLSRVYGAENAVEVSQKNLHGSFNSWAKNKQLVVGNEITGTDSRELADEIKQLVTSEEIFINEKFVPEYSLKNVCQFFLTSNRNNALYLEDDDRRFFIWELLTKAPQSFFDFFDKWYKTQSNIDAIHYYLLNLDMAGFNPHGNAPLTDAKVAMTEDTRSGHATFCRNLMETPDHFLRLGKCPMEADLYTSQELLEIFKREEPFAQVKANTFGGELKAAGFKQVAQIRWGNPERRDRFFVVRNQEKWLKATPLQLRKHLETTKPKGV